ncbi:OmpA family protein [Sphingorhabdus lacus]|uniref:OmpA family protein n=1 Tax=Sphingorhabdus lacus TaxID=392610 RepID=UPI0035931B91
MNVISNRTGFPVLLAVATLAASGSLSAQSNDPTIVVDGPVTQEMPVMVKGPDVKGIITARSGDKLKITTADGSATVISINEGTKIKTGGGLLSGKNKLTSNALLNGLPVTIKTWQSGAGLIASQITFRNNDLKTATMIRNGTAQQFEEQTAATEALRGRMGDIDKYNIKGTTNVYFDTGKYSLSPSAKQELCSTAASAEATDNALMLVVGYTDSVGDEEYNQTLSEKRASSVINYLQQACRWKPYRMLTPTGMAESDPLASNDTEEGKAQNRRVSVNILVSKGLDGL